MNNAIIIEEAGLLTTVQDFGRFGYQRFGMPVGGAMETLSMQLANMLVGNSKGAACLEATIIGPAIRFQGEMRFAICGADFQPQLNSQAIQNNKMYQAFSGDLLSFYGRVDGCRAYIAISGGLDVPPVMGSRSTLLAATLGGFQGRHLKAGDTIALQSSNVGKPIKNIPESLFFKAKANRPVRLMPGPEITHFGHDTWSNLFNTNFTISINSNRMGYRLDGKMLQPIEGKGDIISSATPFGTIQVPSGGQPIILMADRQTTGGYPRMAIVALVDLPYVAQLMPGDSITFGEISLEEAQKLLSIQQKMLNSLNY